jgi:hypothetical protein
MRYLQFAHDPTLIIVLTLHDIIFVGWDVMDPLYSGAFRTTICYQALQLPYYMLHLSVNSKLQSFPQLI